VKIAAPVLVVGQGLAGTLLAWELERAGRDFFVVDAGHSGGASRVGAGLVNPVTGERWVAAPGWAGKAAEAREIFRGIEEAWGVRLVRELRIRREWRSGAEEVLVRAKVGRGDLAPWVRPAGLEAGAAWIEGAWRVDLPGLIAAGRERWAGQGRLREARLDGREAEAWAGPVVWCVGAAEAKLPELRAVGGETLELSVEPGAGETGWREDVVRHDGVWILPLGGGRAWAGASFVREEAERGARREELRASVRRQMADLAWREVAVLAGWRMSSPDRAARSGWLPGREGREGVFNGLGSKGALLAPGLAGEWARRLGVARGGGADNVTQ
jgi:glycine/D-amino acid oxidase-like deaminating enzyme